MPKRFDASVKDLIFANPRDWLSFLGVEADDVAVEESDLSTVSGAVDKVLRVQRPGRSDRLIHVEANSSYQADAPQRTCWYAVTLKRKTGLTPSSYMLLLRPQADGAHITGVYEDTEEGGSEPYIRFRYRVVRLWREPVDRLLASGPGLLPLAPLADVDEATLPRIIERMSQEMDAATTPATERDVLWTATYVLMGLRYPTSFAKQLLKGVYPMQDSVTYQDMMREAMEKGMGKGLEKGMEQGLEQGLRIGRVETLRAELRRLGARKLGQPDPQTVALIESIDDTARLETMLDAVLDAASWRVVVQAGRT